MVRCKSLKTFILDYSAPIPRLDRRFKRILKQTPFDIVHIHSPFAVGSLAVKVAHQHNIPTVATLHSQYRQDIQTIAKWGWLTDLVLKQLMKPFNRCQECWAVNAGMRELYLSEYGLTAKSKVQSNACDMVPVADVDAARREIRERFSVTNDERLLLFVGRINFIKNLPFLIEALAQLRDKGFPFKMVFVGDGNDTAALQKLIRDHRLEQQVVLAGKMTDRGQTAKVYAASDLFVFPSLYDANSLVQIEAASQGLPTLFIRGAKTASSCIEDQNAFMSDNDPAAYAQKIVDIFTDEASYNRVRTAAKRELYVTWDDSTQAVLDDYRRIIREYHEKSV